jgi:hypothetical protein
LVTAADGAAMEAGLRVGMPATKAQAADSGSRRNSIGARGYASTTSVIGHGLQRQDALKGYGPLDTLNKHFVRWSRLGVFEHIFAPSGQNAQARAHYDRRNPPQGASHGGKPTHKELPVYRAHQARP